MIRTSKHNISNNTNQGKLTYLDNLFVDYKHDLEIYIKYIIDGYLPLKINLSSKLLPYENILHSKYKREIYKQASQIIRSQLDRVNKKRYNKYKQLYTYFSNNNRQLTFLSKKFSELNLKNILHSKYFTKPNVNNISINLTNEFFNIESGNHFDNFINIKLPYFNEKGTRALQINIPLNYHKHSDKFKNDNYKLKNNIQLKKINGKYYISLVWEKCNTVLRTEGRSLGIDTGYRKLIATSDNQILGTNDLLSLYDDICNKKQRNSKEYKKKLKERDNLIGYYVNQINTEGINKIIVEDLNNVKHKSKFNSSVNDKVSRWVYRPLLNKIEMICEVKGIELVKVSPAYTSQTCSFCGAMRKESRQGELFRCIDCGYEIDSDYNASINILHRGATVPLSQ
jgi:IS605 OrfB family transposase